MKPSEIFPILKGIGADHLHHANTVITSCTFLEQGALLSRGYVEKHGLKQTPQQSDAKDKQFGIWDRVFLDHVDIHNRGGAKRGANHYGPVLFVLPVDLLLKLPPNTDIQVTKSNPQNWSKGQADTDRWFQSAAELRKALGFGDFDKMLVIQTSAGTVPFPKGPVSIALDMPKRKMSDGTDAYDHASQRLTTAAKKGGVTIKISQHVCRNDCICVSEYKKFTKDYFESRFA